MTALIDLQLRLHQRERSINGTEEIGRLSIQVAWLKRRSGLDPLAAGTRGARRAWTVLAVLE
jgi:hypothetical protein